MRGFSNSRRTVFTVVVIFALAVISIAYLAFTSMTADAVLVAAGDIGNCSLA